MASPEVETMVYDDPKLSHRFWERFLAFRSRAFIPSRITGSLRIEVVDDAPASVVTTLNFDEPKWGADIRTISEIAIDRLLRIKAIYLRKPAPCRVTGDFSIHLEIDGIPGAMCDFRGSGDEKTGESDLDHLLTFFGDIRIDALFKAFKASKPCPFESVISESTDEAGTQG